MPARLSPAVRDHRNDCPEIDWIECPQVTLNLQRVGERRHYTGGAVAMLAIEILAVDSGSP